MSNSREKSKVDRVDEIIADYECQVDAGQSPDRQKFLCLHAEVADELQSYFRGLDFMASRLNFVSEETSSENVDPEETIAYEKSVTSKVESTPKAHAEMFDDYSLLMKLGEGGMGEVFKARQIVGEELVRPSHGEERIVALKRIRSGELASVEAVQRFLAEARVAASLDHPNILPIHDIGEYHNRFYYTMKLIETGSLADHVSDLQHNYRKTAEIISKVARAVHFAHQRGLLHRDLKPGNILIDEKGEPQVIDFGLAKRLYDDGLTQEGQIVGTLKYMPPEQAAGQDLTTAADVYSLGVILYQLLTDKPLFSGSSIAELLDQIRNTEPIAPRSVNASIPADLETICLKCLQKDATYRYQSALELAEDLDHWLNLRPIRARRVTIAERLWFWARRNRRLAMLLSAIVLLFGCLILTVLVGFFQYRRAFNDSQLNLYHSWVDQAKSMHLAKIEGYRDKAWALIKKAHHLNHANENVQELQQTAIDCMGDFTGLNPTVWKFDGNHRIMAVALANQAREVAVGLDNGEILVRSLPDGEVISSIKKNDSHICFLHYSPDDQNLLAADVSGMMYHWTRDEKKWKQTFSFRVSQKSPFAAINGSMLAVTALGMSHCKIWEIDQGDAAPIVKLDLNGTITDDMPLDDASSLLAISSDKKWLAVACRTKTDYAVRVWNTNDWEKPAITLRPQMSYIHCLAFSPDSRFLTCGCGEGVILYDTAADFKKMNAIKGDIAPSVAICPRNQLLAIPSDQIGIVRLWHIGVNRPFGVLTQGRRVHSAEFDSNGRFLVVTGPSSIRVWDMLGTPEVKSWPAHDGGIPGLAFHPDGRRLVSVSKDRLARIWDVNTGELLHTLKGFGNALQTAAFSPSGNNLAIGDHGGEITIWEFKGKTSKKIQAMHLGDELWTLAFSPNGKSIAVGGKSVLAVMPFDQGRIGKPFQTRSDLFVRCNIFDPSGKCLFWADKADNIYCWDRSSKALITEENPLANVQLASSVLSLAFLPNAKKLLYVHKDSKSFKPEIRLWNMTTRSAAGIFHELDISRDLSVRLALSPNGRLLATTAGNQVVLWDVLARRKLFALPRTSSPVWSFAWCPSSNQLAVGTADGKLAIWNMDKIDSFLRSLEIR